MQYSLYIYLFIKYSYDVFIYIYTLVIYIRTIIVHDIFHIYELLFQNHLL